LLIDNKLPSALPSRSVFPAQSIVNVIDAHANEIADKTTRDQFTLLTQPLRTAVTAYANGMQGRLKAC
jgi:hypothetical protein